MGPLQPADADDNGLGKENLRALATEGAFVPAFIAAGGERAGFAFVDFFTAQIRNRNTPAAYAVAVFTLEDLDHAKGRGANVLAEVVGWASGVDRGNKGPGLARVVRNALAMAGIQPKDVDHVNAHGTGTLLNASAETRAIIAAVGPRIPVSSSKSYFGHTLGASGAIEAVISVSTDAACVAVANDSVEATVTMLPPRLMV